MAMRRIVRPTGGKPPTYKPPRFKRIGGVKRKVTGQGARGVGLGLHGKGKAITKKGYTGKGAYGYGQGKHGSGATTPKPPTPPRRKRLARRRLG